MNSPLERVNRKARVLDLLQAGRIRHATNVGQLQGGHWPTIARHAQMVAREAAG